MNETDSPPVPDVPATVEQAVSSGNQQQSPPRMQNNAALVLALIAICLSVGFMATAFFIWNQLQQMTGQQAGVGLQIDQRLEPLRMSIDQLAGAIENRQKTVDRRITAIERHEEITRQEQQSLDHRIGVLASVVGRSDQGWGLAEVEHLLAIASQKLQLQRDVKTAEIALQTADGRLRELADPHYLAVREQIAKDLEALALVPVVDVDGIFLTLGAWMERIDSLPIAGTSYNPVEHSGSSTLDGLTTAADWQQVPRLIWDSLKGLFSFREHDKPVKPMLAPEREYFLRENVRLQLAAARLALLRDDNDQFRAALVTSRKWLEEYFAAEDATIVELQAKLGDFLGIDIRQDLPDVSSSLRLLRQQMTLAERSLGQSPPQSSITDSVPREPATSSDVEVADP